MNPPSFRRRRWLGLRAFAVLIALLCAMAEGPSLAGAEVGNHEFRGILDTNGNSLEDPCGLAVTPGGSVFVSDYYHHAVGLWKKHEFDDGGSYGVAIADVAGSNGPCNLAVDGAGNLYVNYFHGAVVRYAAPAYSSATTIAAGPVTGLAVDRASGDLYINERTQIARFAAPVVPGPPTAVIAAGSLQNSYGLALDEGAALRLYAADAATHTVKVYEPAVEPTQPVAEIDGSATAAGRFVSLVNAGLAVDHSDGHLFVADNTQPGFEHPVAAVSEFSSAGIYRGQLARVITAGAPVGIAVNESETSRHGEIYVTSGNGQADALGNFDPSQASSILTFGPAGAGQPLAVTRSGAGSGTVTSSPAGINCPGSCEAEFNFGASISLTASPAPGSEFSGWSGACSGTGVCQVAISNPPVSVDASFTPAAAAFLAPPGTSSVKPALTAPSDTADPVVPKPAHARLRFVRGKTISAPRHRRARGRR